MAFKFNPTTGKLDTVADPGGSDTQIQVNDGGVFAGFVELLWNKITKVFTVKGDINLDDGGSFTTSVQFLPPTQNQAITFPDASGTVALVAGQQGSVLFYNAGRLDATTALWDTANGFRFLEPFGYATGASGNVTQATSKSTGVTLNKGCGRITTNNASLAADAVVTFTLTNSLIGAGDQLILTNASGGTLGAYHFAARCAAGSATIAIRNLTAGDLAEAIVIGFLLFKAPNI